MDCLHILIQYQDRNIMEETNNFVGRGASHVSSSNYGVYFLIRSFGADHESIMLPDKAFAMGNLPVGQKLSPANFLLLIMEALLLHGILSCKGDLSFLLFLVIMRMITFPYTISVFYPLLLLYAKGEGGIWSHFLFPKMPFPFIM